MGLAVLQVIKSMAKAGGSEPRKGRRKMGSFLVHSQMQVCIQRPAVAAFSQCMFSTGHAELRQTIPRPHGTAGHCIFASFHMHVWSVLLPVVMQVSSNIAAMFMTGAAQNLLAMNIARSMGVVIPDVWMTWAMGALVPGVVSVIMVPALMYKITPPGGFEHGEASSEDLVCGVCMFCVSSCPR